ncbi:unnamed protein product [Boreogadus saida]
MPSEVPIHGSPCLLVPLENLPMPSGSSGEPPHAFWFLWRTSPCLLVPLENLPMPSGSSGEPPHAFLFLWRNSPCLLMFSSMVVPCPRLGSPGDVPLEELASGRVVEQRS